MYYVVIYEKFNDAASGSTCMVFMMFFVYHGGTALVGQGLLIVERS
jgi:hypothetical protein